MAAAIVNVCFDPRLNHELVRFQTKTRLEAQRLDVQRIFVTNEAGGNFGSSLRNAIDLLVRSKEDVALIALLDHDDCQAAAAGVRQSMAERLAAVSKYASEKGLRCAVVTGTVITDGNVVRWSDWQPDTGSSATTSMPIMPRLFG